jgi:proteic killer suppression protein
VRRITDILDLLNAATNPRDVDFPGSFLHPLKGRLTGYWAVRVSGNWRIVFRMEKGDVLDVDYVDYH